MRLKLLPESKTVGRYSSGGGAEAVEFFFNWINSEKKKNMEDRVLWVPSAPLANKVVVDAVAKHFKAHRCGQKLTLTSSQ